MLSRYQPVSILFLLPCQHFGVKGLQLLLPRRTTLILVCCYCLGDVQLAQQELAAVRVTLVKEEQKNAALVAQVRLHLKFFKALN